MRHRHLDVLESLTGLPVLKMDQISAAELIMAGALDQMGVIESSVATAEEEGSVEARLEQCQTVMASWTSDVSLDKQSVGGFPLHKSIVPSIRAIALFVQRDVGSLYCESITTLARKLEVKVLWAMHTGSLLYYTQQYLTLGSVLMKGTQKFDSLYQNALIKWYMVRKSTARRAKVRLMDVLLDPDLSESLQVVISSLAPVIRYIRRQRIQEYMLSTRRKEEDDEETDGPPNLSNLMFIPGRASYLERPHCRALPPNLADKCRPDERLNPCAPLSLFNIDGYIVREGKRPPGFVPPEEEQGEEEPEWILCDKHWEITAVVSCTRYPWKTEVLRLLEPVPIPAMRGMIPRAIRPAIRAAVRADSDGAIADLGAGRMTQFWDTRSYHAQFLAIDCYVHEVFRKAVVSPDTHSAVKEEAAKLTKLLVPPEGHPRARINETLRYAAGYWIARNTPDLPDYAAVHLPVLSSMCPVRWQFREKAPLCVSSLGAHLKHLTYDWLGAPTDAEMPKE
ncbi:hypothetical protein KIPB_007362, partial [Kipferlia bialata]|eukprot:g7362.t1